MNHEERRAAIKRLATGDYCPVEGCKRTKPSNHLMCAPHWRKVPRGLQREVYASARQLFGENHREAYDRWLADAVAALDVVEAEHEESAA